MQNGSGTFLSTDPNDDDGGQRAHRELQESLAKRPLHLPSEETIKLWEKAKSDPPSLTAEERLQILGRWPLDKFNEACQKLCGGRTIDQVLEKAVSSPQDLTRAETTVIIYGVPLKSLEPDPFLRWPNDIRDLFLLAQKAAETERDRTAKENAQEVQEKAIDQRSAARKLIGMVDRENIIWCNRAGWASKLDQNQQWGFALYRTCFDDDEAWKNLQQKLESATKAALAFVEDAKKISANWKIHYIEDKELEGASIESFAA